MLRKFNQTLLSSECRAGERSAADNNQPFAVTPARQEGV
jgi:hypothetical protein